MTPGPDERFATRLYVHTVHGCYAIYITHEPVAVGGPSVLPLINTAEWWRGVVAGLKQATYLAEMRLGAAGGYGLPSSIHPDPWWWPWDQTPPPPAAPPF